MIYPPATAGGTDNFLKLVRTLLYRPDAVIEEIAVAWDAAEGRSDVKTTK